MPRERTVRLETDGDLLAARALVTAVFDAAEASPAHTALALSTVTEWVAAGGAGTLAIRLADGVGDLAAQPGLVCTLRGSDGTTDTTTTILEGTADSVCRAVSEVLADPPTAGSAADELARQGRQLVAALAELAARGQDLAHLGSELAETNRGVVALYGELDERGGRLRAASDAKSRFLASVSHELRSPLNSIAALTALLLDDDSEPLSSTQGTQVRLVQQSAAQLLTLVNGLLDLAKAESGEVQPDWQPVDLNVIFADLRSTLRPVTPPSVELVLDVAVDRPVSADPLLLVQALRNLITNALKFTERGSVRVAAEVDGSTARFSVTDTGVGIAPEHQGLVFEEFFQVPGPLQVGQHGTGLGLPYTRRVLEAMGSALHLTSEPGLGTTFSFALPLAASDTAAGGVFGTVLVVDDEAHYRTLLRSLLGTRAGTVVEATDGSTAAAELARLRPDLVLLDLRMPGGGGEALLRRLADDPALSTIPVVIVTSVRPADLEWAPLVSRHAVLDKADLSAPALQTAINQAVAAVAP
jgi:signal transduction histidine kinase